MRAASGFTLLEMLVALAVFAVLGAISWGALDVLAEQQQRLEARSQAWHVLVMARQQLEQDIRHTRMRAVRGADGRQQPALWLEPGRLWLTRGGGWAGAAEPGHLQRVLWRFDGAHPRRLYWTAADVAAGQSPYPALEVAQVDSMQVQVQDGQGRWHDRWPQGAGPRVLPRAIRVRWDSSRFGALHWQWHWGLEAPPVRPPGLAGGDGS